MTDSNGVAIASLTGTLAGTHMIMARLANSNVSDAQPMTFVADKDSAVVVLQTSKAEIIGNGVDETTLTATVKDPFDNVESSGGGDNGKLHHATGRCGKLYP